METWVGRLDRGSFQTLLLSHMTSAIQPRWGFSGAVGLERGLHKALPRPPYPSFRSLQPPQ